MLKCKVYPYGIRGKIKSSLNNFILSSYEGRPTGLFKGFEIFNFYSSTYLLGYSILSIF
jgi:hypothetical protein